MTGEQFESCVNSALAHIDRYGSKKLRGRFEKFSDQQKTITAFAFHSYKKKCSKFQISISFESVRETIDMVENNQSICSLEALEYSLPPGVKLGNIGNLATGKSVIKHSEFKGMQVRSRTASSLSPGNYYI